MTQWVQQYSKSRQRPYWFNPATGESRWEDPTTGEETPADKSVRASHLLVKHEGSRRPSSWRQEKITRSKEEADHIIRGYRARIVAGESFEAIAKTESDCSSAKNGGDLGWFDQGKMQPSFERAAFALNVGELSDIVESDSGLHIILRTG
ncbi:rotamase-domain-containing protein [Gonapodya prolifera JEL478]|uniref:Peptidyl-prolyl cis-trans isomerase n=1 Tax=Gonapodya prolifera (strain JEL478) TaxID=1344416 RepID=A0A139AS29_GONPJ|nr:rotamase-domain-containing protein [Gonapodya prolifera JEL478]|eukprot:KXS19353.1 rotamase-domain-containing protein [Gonapodya prolifera JEL478]